MPQLREVAIAKYSSLKSDQSLDTNDALILQIKSETDSLELTGLIKHLLEAKTQNLARETERNFLAGIKNDGKKWWALTEQCFLGDPTLRAMIK